jgi:hypothetical protein
MESFVPSFISPCGVPIASGHGPIATSAIRIMLFVISADVVVVIILYSLIPRPSQIDVPIPWRQDLSSYPDASIQINIGSCRQVIIKIVFWKIHIAHHLQTIRIEPRWRRATGPRGNDYRPTTGQNEQYNISHAPYQTFTDCLVFHDLRVYGKAKVFVMLTK